VFSLPQLYQGVADKIISSSASERQHAGPTNTAASSSGAALTQSTLAGTFRPAKLCSTIKKQVDQHLTRWMAKKNIPFTGTDDSNLQIALGLLHKGYKLPSETTFRRVLLPQEYFYCVMKLGERLRTARNITITFDGWTDLMKRAVLAILAILPSRQAYVLSIKDVSAESHTAEFIAGECLHTVADACICAVTQCFFAVTPAARSYPDTLSHSCSHYC
jgi:hypothetical protein